ncbi:hypothetical protein ACH0B5_09350 [Ureibacillus sp. 179-F W5.1 NHS]|uniref:Uncharacterized protein n=1 Tax=Lysinibacillus halotolerans TaxID=1368476 RepID=A0A3M8H4B4_9BACI|nr:hypothetical protein [Lysinibacillus halotolerans]RNC97262.1 hypothetical protein EC501_16165 [Lysinibacillus halotolerans]
MLKIDEQLLNESKGLIGQPLEDAIFNLQTKKLHFDIFGAVLPKDLLLVNLEKARDLVVSIAQKHWGEVDLFLHATLQKTSIDLENANQRLISYFSSPQGTKALFDYLLVHHSMEFENLITLVFGKEVKLSKSVGGLRQIHLYKIGKKFFIHIIYNDHSSFWNVLFLKKIYSIFIQTPLEDIQNPTQLLKQFKFLLEQFYTLNQSVIIMNQLISYIDNENIRSYQLKEFHLFNLIAHYNGGKRHFRKLNAMIEEIIVNWGKGKWALSEKEYTLLIYIQAITAYKQSHVDKVIEYGKYLITKDRLINHAIELLLEYSDVLPNLKPEPSTLVKRYDKNYLEHIFFILIDALVQNKQFNEVIQLIQQHEMASCTSIYDYFNILDMRQEALFKIEATVQRDIAYIVHNSPQYVWQSIEVWLQQYQNEESPYFEISEMTSKHLCNLLKALFATEQFELFEKLMEIYNKYLKVNSHFDDLKEFVSQYVKVKQ